MLTLFTFTERISGGFKYKPQLVSVSDSLGRLAECMASIENLLPDNWMSCTTRIVLVKSSVTVTNWSLLQVFRGSQTSYTLTKLHPKTDYLVRVSAVRQCSNTDTTADLTGAFSPGVSFTTLGPHPVTMATTEGSSALPGRLSAERKQLSDQQWAMIILLGFTVCAIVIAFIAQQIIAYTSHGDDGVMESTEWVVDRHMSILRNPGDEIRKSSPQWQSWMGPKHAS